MTPQERLVGQALIDFCEQHNLPPSELAKAAGYVSTVKKLGADGVEVEHERIHRSAFTAALLSAKGLGAFAVPERQQRALASRYATNPNTGNVLINGRWLEKVGIMPGDFVSVEVVEESGEVVLMKSTDQSRHSEEAAAESAPAKAKKAKAPAAELAAA